MAAAARIVFRRPVADLDVRTNDHPPPVCGWVPPDHVETSLMIYGNA